jgi:hypothetical protein
MKRVAHPVVQSHGCAVKHVSMGLLSHRNLVRVLSFWSTTELPVSRPVRGYRGRGVHAWRWPEPRQRQAHGSVKDGRGGLKGTSGAVGIGDLAISARALLRDESRCSPAVVARASLKLPTGDEDRALGSGEVDLGLGLALEKTLAPTRIYVNVGLTIPTGEPFAGTGVESLPMLSVVWQAGLMEDLNDTNRTADFAVFTRWRLFFGRPSAASHCCEELTK